MAININIRKDSRIITLDAPGKTPIMSRGASQYFYNSMELLCVAYGACFGKELWNYCYLNNINVDIFESIEVTMEDNDIIITVQHPEDLDDETIDNIKYYATHCSISKLLKIEPKIELKINDTPKEKIVDELHKRRCCGG